MEFSGNDFCVYSVPIGEYLELIFRSHRIQGPQNADANSCNGDERG